MSLSPRPRVFAALALCLLAATATPAFMRVVVHFYADFDPASQGPGGTDDPEILAHGGEFSIQGPPNVFSLEKRGGDDTVLVVSPNVFGTPAVLTASLDEPTEESMVNVDLELTPADGVSDLIITLMDDNSGGMIDLEFHDDGTVKIGPYVDVIDLSGQGLDGPPKLFVTVVLRDPLVGAKTWQVTLSAPGAFKKTYSGVILTPGALSLADIQITRPGPAAVDGTWEVDDLIVTSPGTGSSSN